MKKFFTCFFLLVSTVLISQNQEEKISISYQNNTKKEIFTLIEQRTNYHFFYLESWLNEERQTDSFKNETIYTILTKVLQNSSLNFTILDNFKIIITKGNRIHKSLYDEAEKENTTKNTSAPIFIESSLENNNEVIVIGKESLQNKKEKYTITGVIKNALSKTPIEGVVILERDKKISTTTNKNGAFTIDLPFGKNTIETLLLGYKPAFKNLIVFGDGTLNINIIEEAELLDELVITTKKEDNIKEVIAGITQINIEEIKNIPQVLGERDILKVATTLPGIKSAGEGAEGVNVRGGKVDQNLFLLDESVMYNPAHFLGLFSAINPFTTNDLKVYKGNIPAEYGGRISSVFDIKTKDASTTDFKGEASIGMLVKTL